VRNDGTVALQDPDILDPGAEFVRSDQAAQAKLRGTDSEFPYKVASGIVMVPFQLHGKSDERVRAIWIALHGQGLETTLAQAFAAFSLSTALWPEPLIKLGCPEPGIRE
jgi:hypothetical protein